MAQSSQRLGIGNQRDLGDLIAQVIAGEGELGKNDQLRTGTAGALDALDVDPEIGLEVAEPGSNLGQSHSEISHRLYRFPHERIARRREQQVTTGAPRQPRRRACRNGAVRRLGR